MKTNKIASELEPCPLCGDIPYLRMVDDIEEAYLIVCPRGSKCQCSKLAVVFFGKEKDAHKAWNTRTPTEGKQ